MNKKRATLRTLICLLLSIVIAVAPAVTSYAIEAPDMPYLRMDRGDKDAWKGELDYVRFVTKDAYKFGKAKAKYGIDPDFVPSTKGLDTMDISASAQFSTPQFRDLAAQIREYAGEKEVYVVDFREESHALVNGIPISLYSTHNWANEGKTLDEVLEIERTELCSLPGQTVTAYVREDETIVDTMTIDVTSVMTESELVESEGFRYVRIPITDHRWPKPEVLDSFIDFVKSIDTENVWMHFHCEAGKGRTGMMMTLYDIMKNPDVPMEDIAVRNTLLGGSYVLYIEEGEEAETDYKAPYHAEKAKMLPYFYEYVQENHKNNYEVSWSEWIEKRIN